MNTLTNPKNTAVGQQSALFDAFARPEDMDDLGAGIRPSFATLSIRGSKFRTRYRKTETTLLDAKGHPVPTVEVVILASAKVVSKAFFDNPFREGQDYFPRCTSANGIKPDAGIIQPINDLCATCPNNEIKPVQTDRGVIRMKACGDKKRIAIVPASDLENELLGGPMLLILPQSSHTALEKYGQVFKDDKEYYFAHTTWLSFDPSPSFPRLKFERGRALTDEEAKIVIAHRASSQIKSMINDELPAENEDDGDSMGTEGEQNGAAAQPPQRAASAQAPTQAPPPKAQAASQPAAQPSPPAAPSKPGGIIPPKAGGFAVKPSASTVAARGISEAVSKPAEPPPSQRPVAMAPAVDEIEEEPPEMTDDLAGEFGELMGKI